MNAHTILSRLQNLKLTILAAALLASFLILCAIGIVSSTAQPTQKEERELDDKIPKHLPIKIKIKNFDKVKNTNNEKWLQDFEIEVENIGNKPIYFLKITMFFTDVQSHSGNQLGFPLEYGRHELLSIGNRATPEDVPIKPGETYILKYSAGSTNGWNNYRAKHNKPQPKKIGLRFHVINYGDGTGYNTSDGLPVPRERSANTSCGNGTNKNQLLVPVAYAQPERLNGSSIGFINFSLPAINLPVFFLPVRASESSEMVAPPQSGLCCPGTPCFFLEEVPKGNCFCDLPFSTEPVSCNHERGACGTSRPEDYICPDGEHTCTNAYLAPCGATPTPTPTPCPTPHDSTRPNESCYRFGPQCSQTWACAPCGDGQLQLSYRSLA